MMARRVFHDDGLQREFDRLGYVVVPLLAEAGLARLRDRTAELRPADRFAEDPPGVRNVTYHCSFIDRNRAYKRAAFALISDIFGEAVEAYLVGYRIVGGNFYVKPSGRGELTPHQNWPTVADLRETTVTIWSPLVDSSVENGCLHLVPCSHKIVDHIEGPDTPAYFTPFRDRLGRYLEPVPVRAGEGVIFDDSLIHWSPPNLSPAPRAAVQVVAIPTDAVPAYFFRHSDDWFEAVAADADFYLDQDYEQLLERQPDWTGLGFARNGNRLLAEGEFAERLAEGDAIRAASSGRPYPVLEARPGERAAHPVPEGGPGEDGAYPAPEARPGEGGAYPVPAATPGEGGRSAPAFERARRWRLGRRR